MRGHPGIYLLAVALAAFSTAARAAAPPCTLSAPEVSAKIKQDGIPVMMQSWPQEGYKGYIDLVDCVWTGTQDWLDIAVPFIAEMHPDSEDELSDAVQNALLVNPEGVLSEAWPDYFTVQDYICTLSADRYSPPNSDSKTGYRNAMAELDRRMKIVKRVKRQDLKDKVDECLAGFEATKTRLRRFFQIDKSAPASSSASPAK